VRGRSATSEPHVERRADDLGGREANLRAMLERDIADGSFGRGAQLSVCTPEGTLDVAVGESRPGEAMRVDTVHNVWCGTKPMLAVAVVDAFERRRLPLDAPLSSIDPDLYGGIDADAASILRHDAGLRSPDGITAQFLTVPERRRAVLDAAAHATPAPVYSEYAGWRLLADVLTRLTGEPSDAVVRRWCAASPLAPEVLFDLAGPALERAQDRIGPYYTGVPGALVASYHDRAPAVALGDRVALGGYVSMRALLAFYRTVHAVVTGAARRGFPSPAALRAALADRRVTVFDDSLQRAVAFAGGFMVDLAAHGYGPHAPPSAVGHSGLMGNSCALVDLARGVGLALFFNGLNGGPADAEFLRARYVTAVFGDAR
jgi:CubicO group peptidase (beta-lactamase class C family)